MRAFAAILTTTTLLLAACSEDEGYRGSCVMNYEGLPCIEDVDAGTCDDVADILESDATSWSADKSCDEVTTDFCTNVDPQPSHCQAS